MCHFLKLNMYFDGTVSSNHLSANSVALSHDDGENGVHQEAETVVMALPGIPSPSYGQVRQLAQTLAEKAGDKVLVCLEQDMAKALGQALAAILPKDTGILCIDRIRVREGSYLDIGEPVGSAMPVVVKTLVLGKEDRRCI